MRSYELYILKVPAPFFFYQWTEVSRLSVAEVAGSLLIGLTLDLSAAAVLTMLPLCLVAARRLLPNRIIAAFHLRNPAHQHAEYLMLQQRRGAPADDAI